MMHTRAERKLLPYRQPAHGAAARSASLNVHGGKFMKRRLLSLLMAGILVLGTACGSTSAESAGNDGPQGAAKSASKQEASAEIQEAPSDSQKTSSETEDVSETADSGSADQEEAAKEENSPVSDEDTASRASADKPKVRKGAPNSADGTVETFIGEAFYDGVIGNEEDALKAIESVYDRIGADESTQLKFAQKSSSQTDVYYTFNQVLGDVPVLGTMVKVIVDENGKVKGLVSSIAPDLPTELQDDWKTTSEEAEKIVGYYFKEKAPETVEGAAQRYFLPAPDGEQNGYYVWAVYTKNTNPKNDTAYMVHYVTENGEYLYSEPTFGVGGLGLIGGLLPSFDFSSMQEDEWTGNVTHYDGTQEEITVPVMVDPADGTVILGDKERQIICADAAKWTYYRNLSLRTSGDEDFDNKEVLTYYNFIRIWDFYDSIGWHGPDGVGSPSLLLMDLVDENGEPIPNAYYTGGKEGGYQVFAFNDDMYGDCVDVTAHEFTHCVTMSTMMGSLYENEYGAINEALSDIQGNIIEISIDGETEGSWLIGENSGVTARSMAEPNLYEQPGYFWDRYYVPTAAIVTDLNDYGGVHRNSSLLNIISYRLQEAGMTLQEQFLYWLSVTRALLPRTDFAQLAQVLPWCMEEAGYPQYVDAVNQAVEEAAYTHTGLPERIPQGCGMVTFEYNSTLEYANYNPVAIFMDVDTGKMTITWPEKETNQVVNMVPEGKYLILLELDELESYYAGEETNWILLIASKDGWKVQEGQISREQADACTFEIKDGDVLELESDSMVQALEEW